MMTNAEKFIAAYQARLEAAVQADPEGYSYPMAEVPAVAARMVAAMGRGGANLSAAAKAAARDCGIKPTISGIRAYLEEAQ